MDLSTIDIDVYDWHNNNDIVIVNNVLMDRRRMGCNIRGQASYRFAANSAKWGDDTCEVCGARFTLNMYSHMPNHIRTLKHQNALNGIVTIKKRRRKVG